MIKSYNISGMTCSACSSGIERTLGKLEGIKLCEVSLMGKTMKVDFDETLITEDEIFKAVKSLGYGIFNENVELQKKEKPQEKNLFIRFIISVCLLVPLMYVSMGHMLGAPVPPFLDPGKGNEKWFALYQAIIAAAVIGINYAFFKNGTIAVFKRVPNMDTLVALGSGVSFIYSVVLTVLIFMDIDSMYNAMNLHFESAAMIPALVDVGKWLEEKSKKKTGNEIEKLLKLAPDTVIIEENGIQKTISVKEVNIGNILIVKQGEYVPVDGIIIEGSAFVDKCAITGESLPVEVTEKDEITSAALVKSGIIKIRATRVGEDTTLSKIIKMVREAGASKAPIQKFADKVAGIFVPIVVLLSLLTFLIWLIIDGEVLPEHSVTYSISILVVSCPCALGLATPVAIMTATGKGASLGILFKDAESLQKVCDINTVLLDKTATITEGKPKVTGLWTFDSEKEFVLKLACGIEKNSNHPLAQCIVEYAGEGFQIENFKYTVGKGAEADYEGITYMLGNAALVNKEKFTKEINNKTEELSALGNTVIYLADDRKIIALFAIADTLKDGSTEAISYLKARNIRIGMLTGDSANTACAVADMVGIKEFYSEVMPEDKLKAVENVQKIGGRVAMVGDGINDSPALKQADVGIAMGSGTDVAIDSANVVLVSEDLRTLDTVFDLSKATVRNIKENLFWAFIYNVVMLPVAAGVFTPLWDWCKFNPMVAAACMSLSSLFVVGNALRLLLYKNKKLVKGDSFMKKIVHVEGLCCDHCAKRVEDKLSTAKNVISVDVKLKKKIAVIRSKDEVSDEEIISLVTDAGYSVTDIEKK